MPAPFFLRDSELNRRQRLRRIFQPNRQFRRPGARTPGSGTDTSANTSSDVVRPVQQQRARRRGRAGRIVRARRAIAGGLRRAADRQRRRRR